MQTPNSHSIYQRLVSPFQQFGLLAGTAYALNRILGRLSPRLRIQIHDWVVQPVTSKPLLPGRFARSFETREIQSDDPVIGSMPIRPEILQSRLRQNTRCLGTYNKKGQMIGYIWLCFDSYEEDQARYTFFLSPSEQSVFDFDLRIYPEYQMGIGFAALWSGVNQYLYERGVRYSFSRLDRFNQASAKAHSHLGCKRIGGALILQFFAAELIFMSKAPWIHFSCSESTRTRIHLTPDPADLEEAQ